MGIRSLLTGIASKLKPCHISKYRGKRVGVDSLAWLHRSIFTCAEDLVAGRGSRRYIEYCMRFVGMLQANGVVPVMVFDGGPLPAKRAENAARHAKRVAALARGLEMQALGKHEEARKYFTQGIDVSPQLAFGLLKALQDAGVETIIAPYEADAQLAFLARTGQIHAVITEDGDLLAYGCPRVFFKMADDGTGREVEFQTLFNTEHDPSDPLDLRRFSGDKFLTLCCLMGCDYCPPVQTVGRKTAWDIARRNAGVDDAVHALIRTKGRLAVPKEYRNNLARARMTFLHQRVYDPRIGHTVFLTPLPTTLSKELKRWIKRKGKELMSKKEGDEDAVSSHPLSPSPCSSSSMIPPSPKKEDGSGEGVVVEKKGCDMLEWKLSGNVEEDLKAVGLVRYEDYQEGSGEGGGVSEEEDEGSEDGGGGKMCDLAKLAFLGPPIPATLAKQIAEGVVNPESYQPYDTEDTSGLCVAKDAQDAANLLKSTTTTTTTTTTTSEKLKFPTPSPSSSEPSPSPSPLPMMSKVVRTQAGFAVEKKLVPGRRERMLPMRSAVVASKFFASFERKGESGKENDDKDKEEVLEDRSASPSAGRSGRERGSEIGSGRRGLVSPTLTESALSTEPKRSPDSNPFRMLSAMERKASSTTHKPSRLPHTFSITTTTTTSPSTSFVPRGKTLPASIASPSPPASPKRSRTITSLSGAARATSPGIGSVLFGKFRAKFDLTGIKRPRGRRGGGGEDVGSGKEGGGEEEGGGVLTAPKAKRPCPVQSPLTPVAAPTSSEGRDGTFAKFVYKGE